MEKKMENEMEAGIGVLLYYVGMNMARFPSNPLTTSVPFFPLFCFNKDTPKTKRGKGYQWGT